MWVYFYYSPQSGDVLDVRRLNENFEGVSRLFGGGLGEHLWAADFVNSPALVATDIGVRHIRRVFEGNPTAAITSASFETLEPSTTWLPVHDTYYQRTFKTRGGRVEAIFSFVFAVELTVGITPGIQFAVAIDGNVMHETVTGSGDEGGDEIRYAPAMFDYGGYLPNSGGYGPALRATRMGIVVSWEGRLPPGTHTAQLVYRNLSGGDGPGPQAVGQGELNIWERWS